MSDWTGRAAPSLDEMMDLARRALDRLPQPFRRLAADVVLHVQDFADEETLDSMAIEDPFDLTGLYLGLELNQRSVSDPLPPTPRVFLYRRPILDEWAERGDLSLDELVEHVLVHEIGHHFGLSDDDIDAIEAEPEGEP